MTTGVYYFMKITSASHRLAKQSQKHGDCYQYDKAQIDLINTGMANVEDCEPFNYSKPSVKITEFNDGDFEGRHYTPTTWTRV